MFNNKSILLTGGTGSFGNVVLKKLLDPRDAEGKPDEKKIEKYKDLPELEKARKRIVELGGTV